MSKKRPKYSMGWTLVDENIENVERVRLDPETQRELGCSVGQHVFLEYPWAYVPRDTVLRLSKTPGSPFEPFADKIEADERTTILVGYSSAELMSSDFVICCTDEATKLIVKRNRDISRKIRDKVNSILSKKPSTWKLSDSGKESDERFVKNKRQLFEIEITLPIRSLGQHRDLQNRGSGDARDSCVSLLPLREKFDIVKKRQIGRTVQTHLDARDVSIQTRPSFPRNMWTQYVYEDTLGCEPLEADSTRNGENHSGEGIEGEIDEKNDIEKNDSARSPEKGPLEEFLQARSQEVIEVVRYNTVINAHVDDIEALARGGTKITKLTDESVYEQRLSFVDLNITAGKIASDVAWPPDLTGYVAVSYVEAPKCQCYSNAQEETATVGEPRVLLWSFNDSLRPKLIFECDLEACCISFCPSETGILVAGCSNGQIVIWSMQGYPDKYDKKTRDEDYSTTPVVKPLLTSCKQKSHSLAVRSIQWIPENYRVEKGKLKKLSNRYSLQFMTASEDGTVAIWNLLWRTVSRSVDTALGFSLTEHLKIVDGTLHPFYRIAVRSPEESASCTILRLCLPPVSVPDENAADQRGTTELNQKEPNYLRRLWIGTAEGELVCCTWGDQTIDAETDSADCQFLNRSCVHDDRVTEIVRSPHLEDVLLTIGGHVFAIWKDDYLDSPILWRRSTSQYTGCCWSNKPGVFLLATKDGELEIWDIKRRSHGPIFTQSISGRTITHLSLQENSVCGYKGIVVADYAGVIRILQQPEDRSISFVERMDWFEEYIWREVRRKKVFYAWQSEFLANDPEAIAKRKRRSEEERAKKLEEARMKLQKEHDERLRLEEEKKARDVPKTKDEIWRINESRRMRNILLKKEGFVPRLLEEKRLPLVRLEEDRNLKLLKARNEAALHDKYFADNLAAQFPNIREEPEELEKVEQIKEGQTCTWTLKDYVEEFSRIREEVQHILATNPYIPKIDLHEYMKERREQLKKHNKWSLG